MFCLLFPVLVLVARVVSEPHCTRQEGNWKFDLIDKVGKPYVLTGVSYRVPESSKNNVKFTVKMTFRGKTQSCGVFGAGDLTEENGWIHARCKKAMAADSVQIALNDGALRYCGGKIYVDPLRCGINGEVVDLKAAKCGCPKGTEYNNGKTECEPAAAKCESDKNKKCEHWALKGECKANPTYMLPNCSCSCKKYGNVKNVQAAKCLAWAKIGECEKNPGYMLNKCKKECAKYSKCESDKNKQCEHWALKGECKANPTYMLPNCSCSCKKYGNVKNDQAAKCLAWAKIGECEKNPGYMLNKCKKECAKYSKGK